VEAARDRAGGIAELLASGAGFGERGSAPLHQLGRINPARVAAGARLCLGQAPDTHAGELTGGLLASRPRPFLLGRERKPGRERGVTRFHEGLPSPDRRPPAWTLTARTILRVRERAASDDESCGSGEGGFAPFRVSSDCDRVQPSSANNNRGGRRSKLKFC